jgi:hypothetical protein
VEEHSAFKDADGADPVKVVIFFIKEITFNIEKLVSQEKENSGKRRSKFCWISHWRCIQTGRSLPKDHTGL